MVQTIYFQILILIWLAICAWSDWKSGEVSNWLTIPPLVGAAIYALIEGQTTMILFISALGGLTLLFFLNAMGGADVKILSTLAGIWPVAFWGALLAQGVWGVVVLLRKGRRATFRAVPAISIGAVMGFLWLFI